MTEITWYKITYGKKCDPIGNIHKETCPWAANTIGFWVDHEADIPKFKPKSNGEPLKDCTICGGRDE